MFCGVLMAKASTIRRDFRRLQTSIANISGTDRDITPNCVLRRSILHILWVSVQSVEPKRTSRPMYATKVLGQNESSWITHCFDRVYRLPRWRQQRGSNSARSEGRMCYVETGRDTVACNNTCSNARRRPELRDVTCPCHSLTG